MNENSTTTGSDQHSSCLNTSIAKSFGGETLCALRFIYDLSSLILYIQIESEGIFFVNRIVLLVNFGLTAHLFQKAYP